MTNRKIVYITGTRADYGLMRSLLFAIDKNPQMDLELVVTGMHLMEEFGSTVDEIVNDGFKIHKINAVFEDDNKYSMSNFIGKLVSVLTEYIMFSKPDILLVLGDRAEMLAGAIVGSYLSIPVAHIHGGDVTSTVDEHVRHAITKLAHIHFPATKVSAERIIKMGEENWRVKVVGSPAIDSIINEDYLNSNILEKKYDLDLSKPLLIVIQHPVTIEYSESRKQIEETLEAIKELEYQTILIYPNSDAGGREMIDTIKKYNKYPFIKSFKNLPHEDYLSLMKVADVMVGNSSSGIIEAPTFNLPVVNIGTRQAGREVADNVVKVSYDKNEIIKAIKKCLNAEFRNFNVQNPYGDGKSSEKIIQSLIDLDVNDKLLQKKLTY